MDARSPRPGRFSEAEAGSEYVVTNHRLPCANLRQQFKRILKAAGITARPRLFHNLRASRETELLRQYDLTTVCKWISNSPEATARHYAMSMDQRRLPPRRWTGR